MPKGVENELIEYQSKCIGFVCTCVLDSMIVTLSLSVNEAFKEASKTISLQVDLLLLVGRNKQSRFVWKRKKKGKRLT